MNRGTLALAPARQETATRPVVRQRGFRAAETELMLWSAYYARIPGSEIQAPASREPHCKHLVWPARIDRVERRREVCDVISDVTSVRSDTSGSWAANCWKVGQKYTKVAQNTVGHPTTVVSKLIQFYPLAVEFELHQYSVSGCSACLILDSGRGTRIAPTMTELHERQTIWKVGQNSPQWPKVQSTNPRPHCFEFEPMKFSCYRAATSKSWLTCAAWDQLSKRSSLKNGRGTFCTRTKSRADVRR